LTNHLPAEELELLIAVLPRNLQAAVRGHEKHNDLVEIVMDLGRSPEFRTFDAYTVFDHLEVTQSDLKHVIDRVGDFGDDNRAGIARTLHRISAIRNRKARIIGLTLRVGRAVYGTAEIVRDIIASGRSILLLGRPGVGKTTMLRETARILADDKRVVIVDTSNEIAGDGDIPHPAIGRARRMQVSTPALQHEVMIEAVENHNPQVIVIDEIGRELEAQAARTIAERGVQLIGTAHGNTLDNLLMNPTLSDLIGGIESVTLSDEEARRRGTQKSVLERRAPPTFDVLIEIQDWQRLAVHPDVAKAVDGLLRSRPQAAELRYVDSAGEVVTEKSRAASRVEAGPKKAKGNQPARGEPAREQRSVARQKLLLFPYGVSQNRLRQSAKSLSLPLILTDDLTEADALMTLKSYYRKRPIVITDAEARQIPIYVLRSNTYTQIENALVDMFGLSLEMDEYDTAMQEAREAVQQVLNHSRPMVELSPRSASIRRQQHDMARQANLLSLSRGKEPHRRVRIYRKD
jgi:stage III sporulation protein SpoIIIAA